MEEDKRKTLGDKFPKLTDKSKHKDWAEAWKRAVLSVLPTASSILDLKVYGYKEATNYPIRGSLMDAFPRGDEDSMGETDNDGPAVLGMQSSASSTAASSEPSAQGSLMETTAPPTAGLRELSAPKRLELSIQERKSQIDDEFNRNLYLHKEGINHNRLVDELRIQLTNLLVTALTGSRAIQNEFDSDVTFTTHRGKSDIIEMLKVLESKCEQASVDIRKDAFMKRMSFISMKQGPDEPWSAYFARWSAHLHSATKSCSDDQLSLSFTIELLLNSLNDHFNVWRNTIYSDDQKWLRGSVSSSDQATTARPWPTSIDELVNLIKYQEDLRDQSKVYKPNANNLGGGGQPRINSIRGAGRPNVPTNSATSR